jgi:hypothetical protein
MKKGFVFTLEAALSIMLLMLILFSFPSKECFSLKELTIAQEANDLLRVWSAKETSESEMIFDAQMVLGENFQILINGKEINPNTLKKRNTFSTTGVIVDSTLEEKEITLLIGYD